MDGDFYAVPEGFGWDVLSALIRLPGVSGSALGDYRTVRCLYLTPYSSQLMRPDYAMESDGYLYQFGEDSIVIRKMKTQELDGQIVYGGGTRWQWEEFPFTDEQWNAFFLLPEKAVDRRVLSPRAQYTTLKYLNITENFCLLQMDDMLWVVHKDPMSVEDGSGIVSIWSVYTLAPYMKSELVSAGGTSTIEPLLGIYRTSRWYYSSGATFGRPVPDDDDGYLYQFTKDAIVIRSDMEGAIDGEMIFPTEWRWRDFSLSDKEWNCLVRKLMPVIYRFCPYINPNSRFSEVRGFMISEDIFLLRLDGELWIVRLELTPTGQIGCVSSLYALSPVQ